MCKMARLLENEMKYQYYRDILDRGSVAYDKVLWNGKLTAFGERMERSRLCWMIKMSDLIYMIRQVLQL